MPQAHPHGLGLEAGANRLVDYDPRWPRAFALEAARIRSVVGSLALAIEHYGSTAVPGLRAKPILDLLIGVADIDDGLEMIAPMASLGYDYAGSQGIPEHHIFGLGLARTHLAHVVAFEGDQWRRCLRFRDRLRSDPDLRATYQAIKAQLADGGLSRADYTAGKTAFVVANSA
jgi:GrpB-like predicted nucleotidyltransferase (UPF0157 family)